MSHPLRRMREAEVEWLLLSYIDTIESVARMHLQYHALYLLYVSQRFIYHSREAT